MFRSHNVYPMSSTRGWARDVFNRRFKAINSEAMETQLQLTQTDNHEDIWCISLQLT